MNTSRSLLTQREAADACSLSRTTIRRRREAGELPGSVLDPERGWLIPSEDLTSAGFRLNASSPLSGKPKPCRDVPLDGDAGTGAQCEGKLLAEERAARVAAETEAEQLRALLKRLPPAFLWRINTEETAVYGSRSQLFRRMGCSVLVLAVFAMVGLHFWNRLERSHSEDASAVDNPRDQSVIVSDNGRTISAVESWGSCENRPRLKAHESTHTVTLLLKRTWPLWGGRGDEVTCGHNTGKRISVRLDAPLGDRTLTDKFTRRPIPFRTAP